MKTLLTALRVGDLDASLDFYNALGYRRIGQASINAETTLSMLNLPGDGEFVTLELAYTAGIDRYEVGTGFSHLAVQVDDLDATLAGLAAHGIAFEPAALPAGEGGPRTTFVSDPDGYRIELVQWPPGHPDGITRADFL